jgi:hypothetical protein
MKRALLIGINEYPGQPLNGCVNDVTDMADYLTTQQGFAAEDIRLITDDRATTDAIGERLGWLVDGSSAGDTLFLQYSGHGTLFPVRDANGNVTELHGSLCPVDFDWTPEHAIFEDELRTILDRAPTGVEFVFVSDSCHSGDLTRAFAFGGRPRFLFPPADIRWRLRTAEEKGLKPTLMETHDRCGLISGCRKDQTSADAYINSRYNGALTFYLLQALRSPAGGTSVLTDLVADIKGRLTQGAFDQEPQLRGPDEILARAFLMQ